MPSVATTPRRMETFARALDRTVANKIVPRARVDQLRSAFMATDAQGRSWTIDPEFQRWGRLDGEIWMYDDPPPQLFLDSELRASLEAMEAMAARAIVRGDAPLAPSTPWFRPPVAPAEPTGIPEPIPSREPDTVPRRPPDPMVEPAPIESVMSSEASALAEPAAHASVEPMPTPMPTPAPERVPVPAPIVAPTPERVPVPEPTVTPAPDSSIVDVPAVSVASRIAAEDVTPVEQTAPSRFVIPEAHLRFTGLDIAPAADDAEAPAAPAVAVSTPALDRVSAPAEPPASVPAPDASRERERWVPTSIAPRLTAERSETRGETRDEMPDDKAHVVLCGLLATLFLALAVWKSDGRGYAAALLFALLAVTLLVLNLAHRRRY